MIFRPATPGFLVTLTATILLAIVSFNVPLIKSIYFLKANLTISGVNGTITIGTLGYCLELSSNGTTCSSPSVGYTFDAEALVGDLALDVDIPNVVVKWITYALFLHVIALCAAGVSALFGLLAHVREMSMACCSTCVSGLAAALALVAFVFDIVLFFVVKERVQDLEGDDNSAEFGSAVWMTLAAAILLFFSGCVYACGRCMISRRPRGRGGGKGDDEYGKGAVPPTSHAEQMRLDAVRAEAERKARQKNEVGLPAFPEHADVVKPLRHMDDDMSDGDEPYRDHKALGYGAGVGASVGAPRRQGSGSTMGTHAQPSFRGGYAQAPPGTRAVDEYYSSSPSSPARSNSGAPGMSYPPNRQYSTSPGATATAGAAAAAAGVGAGAGYLAASGAAYGHRTSDTSHHTAASTPSQHQQYPSAYSTYNNNEPSPYSSSAMPGAFAASSTSPPPRQPSQPYADPYYSSSAHAAYGSSAAPGAATAYGGGDYAYGAQSQDPYSASGYPTAITTGATAAATTGAVGYATSGGGAYQSPATGVHQPERSYTLGGGGYGANVVPDSSSSSSSPSPAAQGALNSAYGAPALSTSPPPMMPTATVIHGYNANVGAGGGGQNSQGSSYEDAPPGYEASAGLGPSVHVPAWRSTSGFS
ncbi:hypothetical protein ACEPAF_4099 [Sanghuangporus sanghuang]